MANPKVSCVIPAHNEAENIGGVLTVVANHPLIDEIIAIDDCSRDNTREIIKSFKNVKLLIHEENKGKSQTVVDGIKQASGEFIFLLDADLIGLEPQYITDLIEPVTSGQADISISLRGKTPWLWLLIGLDWISGERVFKKEFIAPHLETIRNLPPFGLEAYMNRFIIKNKMRIKVVLWEKVASPLKWQKIGWLKGLRGEFFMRLDIAKTITIFGKYYQIFRMYFLKVR